MILIKHYIGLRHFYCDFMDLGTLLLNSVNLITPNLFTFKLFTKEIV